MHACSHLLLSVMHTGDVGGLQHIRWAIPTAHPSCHSLSSQMLELMEIPGCSGRSRRTDGTTQENPCNSLHNTPGKKNKLPNLGMGRDLGERMNSGEKNNKRGSTKILSQITDKIAKGVQVQEHLGPSSAQLPALRLWRPGTKAEFSRGFISGLYEAKDRRQK